MKKIYKEPRLTVRFVKSTSVIDTSDPQISEDPTDGGQQLIKRRNGSDWDGYE